MLVHPLASEQHVISLPREPVKNKSIIRRQWKKFRLSICKIYNFSNSVRQNTVLLKVAMTD
jgi:hypothetical protein